MRREIKSNLDQIRQLCRNNSVSALYLFGSGLNESLAHFRDVDFAVIFSDKLDPLQRGEAYFSLKYQLEELLRKEVDLVSYPSIKNAVFKESVDVNKVIVYAA